jgi:hypothetical protein
MSFEPQEVFLRNLVLGSKKQTTYGTALLDASLTKRVRFDGGDFFTLSKEFYSDSEKAGKGHNWPTQRQETMRSSAGQLNFDLDDYKAAWLGAFFFGNVATVGAGPYTHTFTFLTATNIFPVTSVYLEDTADLKTKWADLAINSLEISGTATGPIRARAGLLGSGKFTDGAMGGAGIPALQASPIYLLGSDTDILIGAPAGAASIKERIRSWGAKYEQEIIVHRAPGGGKVGTFTKVMKQRASWQLVIAAKDVDDVRTLLINDTIQELQINTNSGAAAQLNLKFPGAYVTAAQIGVDGNEEIWSIESNQDAGVIKNGGANYVEYVAINSEPAFLAVG